MTGTVAVLPPPGLLDLDERSLLVRVEATVRAAELESHLSGRGLTLGWLPSPSWTRTIGELVEEPLPLEGSPRRGPLGVVVVGLSARLAGGERFEIAPAPRRATGPELLYAVIGQRGSLAQLERAWIRIERRPAVERTILLEHAAVAGAIELARRIVLRDVRAVGIEVWLRPRPLVRVRLAGPAPLVEAEAALVSAWAADLGGTGGLDAPELVGLDGAQREAGLQATAEIAARGVLDGRPVLGLGGWHRRGVAVVFDGEVPGAAALADPHALAAELTVALR